VHKVFLILRSSGEMAHLPWQEAKRMPKEDRPQYLQDRLTYAQEVTKKLKLGETDEMHALIPSEEPQLASLLDNSKPRLLPDHAKTLCNLLEMGNYSRPVLGKVLGERKDDPWPSQKAGSHLKEELRTVELDDQIEMRVKFSLMYEEYYYRKFSVTGSTDNTIYKDCALSLCNNGTGESYVIASDGIFKPNNDFISWLYGIDCADQIVELFESEINTLMEKCKTTRVSKQQRLDECLGIDHTLPREPVQSCKELGTF
jgi:hypothetical protein